LVKVLETHDFRMYFTPPTEDNEEGDIWIGFTIES
jgi:hypothetical protein